MTEAEVHETITNVINMLAPRFKFGYYEVSDIKQFCYEEAIEGLKFYDQTRKLAPFMYRHLRNRLLNLIRNKCRRRESPCQICLETAKLVSNGKTNIKTSHEDGQFCTRFLEWKQRNISKANILNPADISYINDEDEPTTRTEYDFQAEVDNAEIFELIDERLPANMRGEYLRIKDGVNVGKVRRQKIEETIRELLCLNKHL